MKRIIYSILTSIVLIIMLATNAYAFENEIYKMDVPSYYKEKSSGGINVFEKSDDVAVVAYAYQDVGLKKNISTMTKSEINEIIEPIASGSKLIEQKKEKLGNSKAIKARIYDDGFYMDIYILVSDNHILLIAFTASSETYLDGEEFTAMKKSFKMKEKTTNATALRIGGFALAAGGGIFYEMKKKKGKVGIE